MSANNRRKGTICTRCKGRGTVDVIMTPTGMLEDHSLNPRPCPRCGGRGWVSLKKVF